MHSAALLCCASYKDIVRLLMRCALSNQKAYHMLVACELSIANRQGEPLWRGGI